MNVWSIVVAAGSGTRFGGPKQDEPLGEGRVLDASLRAARNASDGVVLVVAADRLGDDEPLADHVVAGGATRSASVRAGLAAVPDDAGVVVIHDGARPLATPALFAAVIAAIRAGADAAIPVVAVTDTLVTADAAPVDRDGFRAVQTPQGFGAAALRAAHATSPEATDDASLVHAGGGKVVLVPGDPQNLKITEPHDLLVARALWDRL